MPESLEGPVDLTVSAESERFDPDDSSWLAQAGDLYQDLRQNVAGYRLESRAQAGTKGTVDAVILSLGSAGAFSAAVQCWRSWLARDKSRRVAVRWTSGDREERIVLAGDGLDTESLHRLIAAVGQRVAGG